MIVVGMQGSGHGKSLGEATRKGYITTAFKDGVPGRVWAKR